MIKNPCNLNYFQKLGNCLSLILLYYIIIESSKYIWSIIRICTSIGKDVFIILESSKLNFMANARSCSWPSLHYSAHFCLLLPLVGFFWLYESDMYFVFPWLENLSSRKIPQSLFSCNYKDQSIWFLWGKGNYLHFCFSRLY